MIIGVDVDGVLRDIITPVIKVYKKEYDYECIVTHNTFYKWRLYDNLPKITNDVAFFKKYSDYIFGSGQYYVQRKDLIKKLIKLGHKVIIVTNQIQGLESLTLDWLNKNSIHYDSIYFVKENKDKFLIKMNYIIDDNLETINMAEKYGVKAICISQAWNGNSGVDTTEEIINVIENE
jgi:uncharacterized HAD superfamily protein